MRLFRKEKKIPVRDSPEFVQIQRACGGERRLPPVSGDFEKELYDRLRDAVPVVDAALMKTVRLTGGFRAVCSDERFQEELERFAESVPVGTYGVSLGTFADELLDSILTYGSAVGEIVPDVRRQRIAGLWVGDVSAVRIMPGKAPFSREYSVRDREGNFAPVKYPERIVYASLPGGRPVLRGIPALSSILMRIYECIGQNYDRIGNVRYAVTYRPPEDQGGAAYSRERAVQIAKEWADGMNSAKYGQVKDFIAVGDVDIKVIGSENQLFDTNIPVRQLLEQIISKLSIPPFLLGLNWSSTERMSQQQADILTSELEYYRRLITPALRAAGDAFLCSIGADAVCRIEWDNINLQDEAVLAQARLDNARAREIEARLEKNDN